MTLLSDPREASGHDLAVGGPRQQHDLTDGQLLAAVRAGDADAYATLYAIHSESVMRLARRLCRDRHEADDVVSDVFANTLRAIQHGGGPRDEFGLYALRAVRNTVTKLRTRTDSARATPTDLDVLDRPDTRDPFRLTGDVERAFADLPERFRDVLWTTAVEGRTPSELAEADAAGLDPGALASLSQRARKALGRSYLRVRTDRPARTPECNRVRGYLPGYVQHTTGGGTAQRIEQHLAHCADCAQVRDEMRDLNGKLRTIPWLALLAAAIRRVAVSVAGAGIPTAATAAAPIVAIAVAGTLIAGHATREATLEREPDASVAFAEADAVAPPEPPDPIAALPTPVPIAGSVGGGAPGAGDPDAPTPGPFEPAVTPSVTPIVAPGTPHDGPAITGISIPPTSLPTTPPTTLPTGLPLDLGSVGSDSVVGAIAEGATGSVGPAATAGVGTLIDDLNNTVTDVNGVVEALPNGIPAVLDEAGNLIAGVGDTLTNTTSTVGTVGAAATDTVDATVEAVAATAGQAGSDLGGTVDATLTAVIDPDPADPVGGVVGAAVGGLGTTIDGAVGGLLDPTAPSAPVTSLAPGCSGLLCLLGG